jgi:hypothetical protein
MKKFVILSLCACNAVIAFPQDWFVSDTIFNVGYLYNKEAPLGFELGLGGLAFSASLPDALFKSRGITYNYAYSKYSYPDSIPEYKVPGFGQISLSYGVKIFKWLRIPVGVSLYATSISFAEYSGMGKLDLSHWGFNAGVELLINPFSGSAKISLKAQTINFKYFFLGAGVALIDGYSAGKGYSYQETARERDYFSYSAAFKGRKPLK